jgi:hypothetical protein
MKRSRAILVALIVLAAASLLMFLVVLPNTDAKKAVDQVADATKAATQDFTASADKAATEVEQAAAKLDAPAPAAAPVAVDVAKSEPATEVASIANTLPAFDVLRVEPDGSTVIAGRAAPGSDVAISDGKTVISTVKAGDTGDFAAVLDDPLAAGDHQLVLQTKDGNGKTVTSAEVATISVPKDKGGELLAMVSKPGEASRIMAMPTEAAKAADTASTDTSQPATVSPGQG